MKLVKKDNRIALYALVVSLFCLISSLFVGSMSVFGFGLVCASFFLSQKFIPKKASLIVAIVLILIDIVAAWISFVRLTKSFGYDDYAPTIATFPICGVILLCAFFILLCAKDDAEDRIKPSAKDVFSKVKQIFLLACVCVLASFLTYTTSYYFEPACCLLMCLFSLFDTFKPYVKKPKIEPENRLEIKYDYYLRQLSSGINVSDTCFVFISDTDRKEYHIFCNVEKHSCYLQFPDNHTVAFANAEELLTAPLFEEESLFQRWDDVFLYTIEGVNTDYWLRHYEHD